MREQITVIRCDDCGYEKQPGATWACLKRGELELDLCPTCLEALHEAVTLEHRRVIHNQVPDRRGGWRNLGEYDG